MEIEKIFNELRTEFKKYEIGLLESKKQIAPDFNAFEILYALELPLSRMIGEFLNPKGTHAQGQIFLDLFIDIFLKNNILLNKSPNISLKLEHAIENGRIDIFLDFDNKFGIAIENKPFATDQDKQIVRYCDYLSSVYGNSNFLMIYLSSDGSEPTEISLPKNEKERLNKQFIIISYSQIRVWFLECAKATEKSNSVRLTTIIYEFAEYINRIFCGTNSLRNNMIGEIIKRNIIDAFEINLLWNSNKTEFENIWKNKINNLINKELPKLIFEKLQNENVINDNWEIIEGKFDISKKHLAGFKLKKRNWKHFAIGISSTAHEKVNGTQNFFPIIISDIKIAPATKEQTEKYNNATGCNPQTNWIGGSGKIFWSANFPENNFYNWDYEQWSEIKLNGKTVNYVGDFLANLIKICELDIDTLENNFQKFNSYTESDLRNFVNKFQWIFAKTYADKAPHEYIVLDKVGNQYKDEFVIIAQFIRNKGFKALYYTREGFYYKLDENYYWTMDDNVNDTNLINRAKLSDYELIDNSWYWKGRKLNNDEK